jgi:hypothetical protein
MLVSYLLLAVNLITQAFNSTPVINTTKHIFSHTNTNVMVISTTNKTINTYYINNQVNYIPSAPIFHIIEQTEKDQLSTINYFYLLSCVNIYNDIFINTYGNLKIYGGGSYEVNPIANIFWNNNMWVLGYISSVAVNAEVVNLILNTDWQYKNEIAYCYLMVINAAEIIAVNTSKHTYNERSYKVECPIIQILF